ncbi:MAG: DJ-1/PfpI/YhbO family deglycase/protease [Alphaproteobacteria bacterium]|nr:DJ-1/PfpI/YhbO family deglycase/protease [Alphaproteobacteria bacterium]
MKDLSGRKIAILATDGFEQSELTMPFEKLAAANGDVHVISIQPGSIRGWNKDHWDKSVPVDRTLDDVRPDDYEVLVLPGGQINPDVLRTNEAAVAFVRDFVAAGKPVAAICHGPWMLVEAGVVKGRKLTSYHSIRTDMKNAGANWTDQEVVVDGNLITSRNPDDLPAFIEKIAEAAA